MTSVFLDEKLNISREEVIAQLAQVGVDSRPAFPAISQYAFWPTKQSPQPVGKTVGERAINLPSGVMLTRESVDRVSSAIIKILDKK